MTQAPSCGQLHRLTPYRDLSQQDCEALAAISQLRVYERNEAIFREGDDTGRICVVASGRVKVFKTTPQGKDLILHILEQGSPVGTVAVFAGQPYPASAAAMERSELVETPSKPFFHLLETRPSLTRALLKSLTQRLIELTQRITELSGGQVEPRFARLFLKLARETGEKGKSGIHIPLSLSRQELADLTGTTIETCIRIMSRWGKEAIVATSEEGFEVLDADALREISLS